MDPLHPTFYSTFDSETISLLQAALNKGVESARDNYDPTKGSNATTFGVDVYNFIIHELETMAIEHKGKFKVDRSGNHFRLRIGKFVIACHRVGGKETEDINSSFPNTSCSASRMAEIQPYLPGLEPDLTEARNFILSHFANHEDGLCKAYLCVPKSQNEWAYAHQIWEIDRTERNMPANPYKAKPAPEKVADFKLNKKKKEGEANADGNA